jgi:hypothetical protein
MGKVERVAAAQLDAAWRERFADLPRDCGCASPGVEDVEEWREWSHRETTPDQQRIEECLDALDLEGLSILHVGIGNSEFASRFSPRVRRIAGLTISPLEVRHGERLALANYRPMLRNKYAGGAEDLDLHFDIVIDNNPSSFACCRMHFLNMMTDYATWIRPNGMILTDRVGLGWVVSVPEGNPRWSFDFEDWDTIGGFFGLNAARVTEYVYALAAPEAPFSVRGPR